MRSGGGIFVPGAGGGVQDEREAHEAFLQGQGEVGEGVDREVLSQGRGGNSRSPAEGEVY